MPQSAGMRTFLTGLLLASSAVADEPVIDADTSPAPHILIDQFGYLPGMAKVAVIRDPKTGFDAERDYQPGSRFAVMNTSGDEVFRGKAKPWRKGQVDPDSGDRVWHFDFSDVSAAGTYRIRDLGTGVESDAFDVSPDVYAPVLRDAFKSFFYQRAGFEKREPFVAEGYDDAASHLGDGQDTEARRYDAKDDPSTARDLRGGWYDAGDYNQYTSWTANYVAALLESYRSHPAVWTDDMAIPESGNGVPDVIDEALWGLAWLERMQNADGSMLSVLGRAEGSPPSEADGPSYYGPPNTSATITAAGVFALASEVLRGEGLEADTDRFRDRALKAWSWADSNPDVQFFNNSEAHGSQGLAAGQQEVDTERLAKKTLIAATQLYGLTDDPAFAALVEELYGNVGGIGPETANGFEGELAFVLLSHVSREGVSEDFAKEVRADYEAMMEAHNGFAAVDGGSDPYLAPVDGYWWGSNGTKSRRGAVYSQALVHDIGNRDEREMRDAAAGYLHYLHGVNPMGLVYLTNMGHAGAERSASTLYHAWFVDGSGLYDSNRTSRYGPPPGLMVGGPNPSYARDACCDVVCGGYGAAYCELPVPQPPTGQPPAKSYAEFNDGWPINSWSVTENSLGYQSDYIRLLAAFVDANKKAAPKERPVNAEGVAD